MYCVREAAQALVYAPAAKQVTYNGSPIAFTQEGDQVRLFGAESSVGTGGAAGAGSSGAGGDGTAASSGESRGDTAQARRAACRLRGSPARSASNVAAHGAAGRPAQAVGSTMSRASLVALGLGSALSISFPAVAAQLVRGPFLQQTSASSTLVVVKTDAPANVEIRSAGASATSQGTHHVLALPGLVPASTITYEVVVDAVSVASGTFRTPGLPATEAGRHAVIGVIGDMGSGGDNERANVLQMKARGVQAVLTVGDNAYPDGAAGDWDPKFFEPFSPLLPHATLWPALGDHEYLTPYASGYLDAFELPQGPHGERYYAFDWGDLHVVALDTTASISRCRHVRLRRGGDSRLAACRPEGNRRPLEDRQHARAALATGKYGFSQKVAAALIGVRKARRRSRASRP
jgi:hypothetical protein